jgi:hypothetical protein
MRRVKERGVSSVGTSEDGEESSSIQDEEDDVHLIVEMLSTVKSPQVKKIFNGIILGMIVLLQYTLIANLMICASCTGTFKREIGSYKEEKCFSIALIFFNVSTWQCTRISLDKVDYTSINVYMCSCM